MMVRSSCERFAISRQKVPGLILLRLWCLGEILISKAVCKASSHGRKVGERWGGMVGNKMRVLDD